MSWFLLIILAIVVFMNRYILLEPNLPLRFTQMVSAVFAIFCTVFIDRDCHPNRVYG